MQPGRRIDDSVLISLTPRFSEVVHARRENSTISTVFRNALFAAVPWQAELSEQMRPRSIRLLTSAATLSALTNNRKTHPQESRFTKLRGRMKGARDSQAVGIGGFPLRSQVGTNCEISPAWLDEIHQAEK